MAKRKILIADPERSWSEELSELWNRKEFEGFLGDDEFDVVAANNYDGALRELQQSQFIHVLITDIHLNSAGTDERGIELINFIRQKGVDTEVFVLYRSIETKMVKRLLGSDCGVGAENLIAKKRQGNDDFYSPEDFLLRVVAGAKRAEEARLAAVKHAEATRLDIFVVMPFADTYQPVFLYIQEVAEVMDKVCATAEQRLASETENDIMSDIRYGIQKAEVVIAELSGNNPNVYFELGLSSAWQKKIVLIAEEKEKGKIPDILSRYRIVFYQAQWGKEATLQVPLRERLEKEFSIKEQAKKISVDVVPSLCFVATSPTKDGWNVYKDIIRDVVDQVGMENLYLWDDTKWHVFEDGEGGKPELIEQKLAEAFAFVADLSGNDPTVFYLAGLALGLEKRYKFLYLQDQEQEVPFDVKHLRLLKYSNNTDDELENVRRVLHEILRAMREKFWQASNQVSGGGGSAVSKPTRKTVAKTSILFLAAEPTNKVRLRLEKEFHKIKEELSKAKKRRHFALKSPEFSLRAQDITRAFLETEVQIVHFSGHGSAMGQLYFETEEGDALPVEPQILAELFKQFSGKIKCVILNACYSEMQAQAIVEHIDYVIGMHQKISNVAAVAFSVGFYQALGAGKNIEEAFEMGKIQSGLNDAPEYQTPVLLKRKK
jgi:CheY-like chemotaxis protein